MKYFLYQIITLFTFCITSQLVMAAATFDLVTHNLNIPVINVDGGTDNFDVTLNLTNGDMFREGSEFTVVSAAPADTIEALPSEFFTLDGKVYIPEVLVESQDNSFNYRLLMQVTEAGTIQVLSVTLNGEKGDQGEVGIVSGDNIYTIKNDTGTVSAVSCNDTTDIIISGGVLCASFHAIALSSPRKKNNITPSDAWVGGCVNVSTFSEAKPLSITAICLNLP